MRVPLLLLVPLLALAPSCARMERARECRRLNQIVNPALDGIERRQQQDPSRPETYESIGRRYGALASDLRQFKTKDQALAQAVSEYQVLAQGVGQSSSKAASAMRDGNAAGLNEARAELSNQRQSQQGLNRQIEQACRAP
jgi:hypothetical protein